MTRASGEVLPRFGEDTFFHAIPHLAHGTTAKGLRSWLASRQRRRKFLALIITGNPKEVSTRILSDLGRGVTAIEGRGMYTGADRTILMCALTVTEVHNLKTAVAKEDPRALVIVSPTQEILGGGFDPLAEETEK